MSKQYSRIFGLVLALVYGSGTWSNAQQAQFQVSVDLVQLNVAVTDNKGNYVTGLKPSDFQIVEDNITEKIAFFGEGNEPARNVLDPTQEADKTLNANASYPTPPTTPPADQPDSLTAAIAGANVFILFDTSNYMYRGFVFAQDAIAEFVRSLEKADKIAFYSYSRDLSRAASLTGDRSEVVRGVRTTVAGDDAALYNSLLLTVKDAAGCTGRKVVVVFSNGPDNTSVVPPEDVAELAQSAGIPIYMISTREARLEPVSTAVFERMTAATGGKAYFSKNWRDERKAFASIRDDLGHLYSLSYYPKANTNHGWRTVTVKLVGDRLKNYHVRTRNGYRPQPNRFAAGSVGDSSPTLGSSN
ncbi:MAG TPA: VWA domain-containing protein [Terriglobales bacterium]|jgi:Ca-activated chloride channel family protein|nr:VWA domain-containing protein [Terriglobales bacterium]